MDPPKCTLLAVLRVDLNTLGSNHLTFGSSEASFPLAHDIPFTGLRVELELKVKSFGLLQHSEIMAGLGFEPERHTGIVLSHHLVEEASGLCRNTLALFFTV